MRSCRRRPTPPRRTPRSRCLVPVSHGVSHIQDTVFDAKAFRECKLCPRRSGRNDHHRHVAHEHSQRRCRPNSQIFVKNDIQLTFRLGHDTNFGNLQRVEVLDFRDIHSFAEPHERGFFCFHIIDEILILMSFPHGSFLADTAPRGESLDRRSGQRHFFR